MDLQQVSNYLVLLISAAVALGLAAYSRRRRDMPASSAMAVLMLAVAVWALASAWAGSGGAFAVQVQHTAIAVVPPACLASALLLTGRANWLTRRKAILLAAVPLTTVLTVWTNSLHHLMWSTMGAQAGGASLHTGWSNGPWGWVHSLYSYALALLATGLLLRAFVRALRFSPSRAAALLGSVLAPLLAHLMSTSQISPLRNLELTPLGLVLGGLVLVRTVSNHPLTLHPPAAMRDAVLQIMEDGVLVLDPEVRITHLNPAAEGILGVASGEALGQPAGDVFSDKPDLLELIYDVTRTGASIQLRQGKEPRSYDVTISALYDWPNHYVGRMVILRDATDRSVARRLSSTVRTIEKLYHASRSFVNAQDPDAVLQTLVENVAQALPAHAVTAAIVDQEGQQITYQAKAGPGASEAPEFRFDKVMGGPSGQVLSENKPLLQPKERPERHASELQLPQNDGAHGPSMIVPLRHEGRVLGVLTAITGPGQRDWAQRDVWLVMGIADQAGEAFSWACAAKSLEESEARYRAVVEDQSELIIRYRPDGTVVFANEAFCRYFGKGREELIGSVFSPAVVLEDQQRVRGQAESLTPENPVVTYDQRVLLRKGEVRWQRRTDRATFAQDGSLIERQAVIHDITEHKRALQALGESEKKHRLLLSSIRSPLVALTKDLEVLYCNAAFAELVGLTEGELEGRKILMQYPELAGSPIYSAFLAVLETGQPDGAVAELAGRYWRAQVNPTPWGVLSTLEDITALVQARDQALEASRTKSEFLATISHEVRTPMNAIVGMTELLLDMPVTEEQRELASVVVDQTHGLLAIIENILDFSKMEAGKLELESIDFQPTEVVTGIVEWMAPKAGAKGLELREDVAAELPKWLRGDPARLRQVLLNVVDNAIKFTERGRVSVKATLESSSETRVTARFTVADTGIGVAAKARPRLFEPFVQGDSSTTRRYGGTGLGLAISKRLVELMGGQIAMESVEGQGTTVSFTANFERSTTRDLARVEPDLQGLRVLIAPSQADEAELIDGYLHTWGIDTRTVSNAEEARNILNGSAAEGVPFDVLVTDPGMPGVNALRRAILTDPALASTRLILLAGPEQQALAERGSVGGSIAYLSKPVEQPSLYNAIVNAALGLPQAIDAAGGAEAMEAPAARLVLLAEDNEPTQTMVLLQLQRLGYSAHTVSNGRQAVHAVSLAPSAYGLILMDCQMPEMDGFAATMAIREMETRTKHHIPIVAMTAYATQHDREKCLAAGMDDYVSKPITRDNLRQILERWLQPLPATQASPS